MNLKTHSILAALALAITTTAQAGPGPRAPGVITPRSIVKREVIVSCSRCQQPIRIVERRSPRTGKTIAVTALKTSTKIFM